MERQRRSSGISDDAAEASHDLIHNAEVEEQRLHPNDSQTVRPYDEPATGDLGSSASGQTGSSGQKDSMMGKVKKAMNIGK
ncbi:hypothetical protein B0I35DRAFT_481951 [Stachybotrys elegans]|uniref:Uncharacterized protein n=1 Tax=Stachybotrys elegans TaxID=80388 RepID=A0A8K0SL10_9HYPO|nr:hypothetical protein B0I35DRAFT_481951 [Stachybotrys elegans]